MNLLGPELVRDRVSLIQAAERDESVQVLVFRSADPDDFISRHAGRRGGASVTTMHVQAASGGCPLSLVRRRLPLTRRALAFAVEQHGGQRRDADRAPFILHPLEVAQLLHGRGCPDAVVAAGVLHDVIEDTDVGVQEIRARFGAEVARIVVAVSEPVRTGPYAYRKDRLRARVSDAGRDALVVYAADKIAKMRELRLILVRAEPAPAQLAEKLEHYWASLSLLERRIPEYPFVGAVAFRARIP